MRKDFNQIHKIFFIGIGGIGMSALARYFLAMGKEVYGSDSTQSAITDELTKEGVTIFIGHNNNHITTDIDLIIYTHAISPRNPEWVQSGVYKISRMSYAQALGVLTKEKFTIAIAGTHGKSTTTAMIAVLMERAGLDPTVIVGTKIKEFGHTNFRYGKSNFLVIEACEYRRSFLEYYPHIVVVPNIDIDHLDYFRDERDYVSAFQSLFKRIPHTGYLVTCADDHHINTILSSVKGHVLQLQFIENTFVVDNHLYEIPSIQIPGQHNRIDASLAFMTGKLLDISETDMRSTLSSFSGTWRRFEYKGQMTTGALLYDDYGHHPTEIQATLSGARDQYPDKNIICVFQPHQYSRTKHFLSAFGKSFYNANLVIIPNIYEARDDQADGTMVDNLVLEIQGNGVAVFHSESFKQTAEYIQNNTQANDVVITMGAGDIYQLHALLPLVE